MNELTAALKEELNVDTAFTLPIFGGIDIPESIAVSWGIMAFLVIVSILLTRNLKVNHISKRQAILETAVVTMDNFFKDLLGEAGKQYVPYLITVALYIACSNLIGIIGLKPPTKDLNVTAALAIMSIVLIDAFYLVGSGDRCGSECSWQCDHVGNGTAAVFHGNHCISDRRNRTDTADQQCCDLCRTWTYRSCRRGSTCRMLCTDGWICSGKFPRK